MREKTGRDEEHPMIVVDFSNPGPETDPAEAVGCPVVVVPRDGTTVVQTLIDYDRAHDEMSVAYFAQTGGKKKATSVSKTTMAIAAECTQWMLDDPEEDNKIPYVLNALAEIKSPQAVRDRILSKNALSVAIISVWSKRSMMVMVRDYRKAYAELTDAFSATLSGGKEPVSERSRCSAEECIQWLLANPDGLCKGQCITKALEEIRSCPSGKSHILSSGTLGVADLAVWSRIAAMMKRISGTSKSRMGPATITEVSNERKRNEEIGRRPAAKPGPSRN